jgi:hypothetical protein
MVCFFAALARAAFQPGYSLVSPFTGTNVNEIGNWTMRGSAVNLRTFLRLTSSQPSKFGAVCARIPTLFRDWKIEMELNAFGGTCGCGFVLSYSEELCPLPGARISGFSLLVNSTSVEESWGYYPLLLNRSNLTFGESRRICSVPVRSDDDDHLLLSIEKLNSTIAVSFSSSNVDWDDQFWYCGKEDLGDLPEFGYFTLSAFTSDQWTDDHDLYTLETHSLSEVVDETESDRSHRNRRILEGFREEREQRRWLRQSEMPHAMKYAGNPVGSDLSDAFRIVNETINRSVQVVSKKSLERFLNTVINGSMGRAMESAIFASEGFVQLKADVDQIGSYFITELGTVVSEMKNEMDTVQRDLAQYAHILTSGGKESSIYRSIYDDALADMSDPSLNLAFFGICVLETVIYVVFGLIRIRRTRGFKKAD